MSGEVHDVQQAVARALRDSLESLQRTTSELNQAMEDLVSSASSSRPTNALPAALRAQTSAAALAAAIDVIARFITTASQSSAYVLLEQPAGEAVEAPAAPPPRVPVPMAAEPPRVAEAPPVMEAPPAPAPVKEAAAPVAYAAEAPAAVIEMPPPAVEEVAEAAPMHRAEVVEMPPPPPMPELAPVEMPPPPMEEAPAPPEAPVAAAPPPAPAFDLNALSFEMQEIHRRANRAAKVSMQDIKLLKPKEVQAGRENHDICVRLRDDIDKARKEYDRRFKTILDQPVDYFYQWMVDILADGKPELLGQYPYPSPLLHN